MFSWKTIVFDKLNGGFSLSEYWRRDTNNYFYKNVRVVLD